MALSAEQVATIQEAKRKATELVNADGKIFDPSDSNWEILRKFLVAEGITVNQMLSEVVWSQAILENRKRGTLIPPKTREEWDHERHKADRTDGSYKSQKNPTAQPNALKDLFTKVDEKLKGGNSKKSSNAAEPDVVFPPIEKEYADMSKEEQAMYRALSTANMRLWLRRRELWKHEQKYPTKFIARRM